MEKRHCKECSERLECLEKGGSPERCPLIHPLFDPVHTSTHSLVVTEPIVDREFAFEHRGCPNQPAPDELAMFHLFYAGDDCVMLRCNYCKAEIIFWFMER